jgi:hypothetical protein
VVIAGCFALAAVAVTVTLRWALVRVDSLGRVRPFPAIAVGVPAVAALAFTVPLVQHARLESRLATAAGVLAGVAVAVHCQTVEAAWLDAHPERGYVEVGPDGLPAHETVITYDTCNDLGSWLGSDKTDPSDAQVVAVHVLAHESMHMSGLLVESRAECAAMQRDAQLALLLGATGQQAHRLARHYWLVQYPTMPADYRDSGCGPAGALDEHLTDSPWTALGTSDGSAPVANAPMAQLRHCLSDNGSPSSDCGATSVVVEDNLATTPVA